MDEKFTSGMSEKKKGGGAGKDNKEEEEEGGKSGTPATFLSAPESIKSVTKYCTNFEVNNYTMAAFSDTENVAYMVEQKVKKQQLTLTNTWKN